MPIDSLRAVCVMQAVDHGPQTLKHLLSLPMTHVLTCDTPHCFLVFLQVHAGQMGSTVSWLPQQPLCVASISKAGQLVLQDVRLLGRPLLQQQLEGPVFDAVWLTGTNPWASPGTPAAAAAAAAVVGGVGSADGGSGAAAGASSSAAAATGGDVGGASSGGVQQLQLVVVGRDSKLRAYSLDAASLQRGGCPVAMAQ